MIVFIKYSYIHVPVPGFALFVTLAPFPQVTVVALKPGRQRPSQVQIWLILSKGRKGIDKGALSFGGRVGFCFSSFSVWP